MNVTSGDYGTSNIYQACNDEFRKSVHINRVKLSQSTHHLVTRTKKGQLDVILDKDADDIDSMFISKGTAIPPDEILLYLNHARLKIPIKPREDFASDVQLPSSDLLNVLHYYTSDKASKNKLNKIMERSFDETALIAFGLMVELWIDDAIDDNVMKLFLEKEEEEKPDLFDDTQQDTDPEDAASESGSESESSLEGSSSEDSDN